MQKPRTLLIDNYDSYTSILAHLIAETSSNRSRSKGLDDAGDCGKVLAEEGELPVTFRNDSCTVDDVKYLVSAKVIDRIVISPGPGTPNCDKDSGVTPWLLREMGDVPIFGVCFGFQAIAKEHSFAVERARQPKHGEVSDITVVDFEESDGDDGNNNSNNKLFKDVPNVFKATRYHSLEARCVSTTITDTNLIPLAWADSSSLTTTTQNDKGTMMALRHRTFPHYGVQFHPESICTEPYGKQIVKNFMDIADAYNLEKNANKSIDGDDKNDAPPPTTVITEERKAELLKIVKESRREKNTTFNDGNNNTNNTNMESKYRLDAVAIDLSTNDAMNSETLFKSLFAKESRAFWLDSATADSTTDTINNNKRSDNDTPRGRFSIMGSKGGDLWRRMEAKMNGEVVVLNNKNEIVQKSRTTKSVLDEYIEKELIKYNVSEENFAECACLPNELLFACGFVGSVMYEMREECDSPLFFTKNNASTDEDITTTSENNNKSMLKAALFFVDRALVVDHETKKAFVMTLTDTETSNQISSSKAWRESIQSAIENLLASTSEGQQKEGFVSNKNNIETLEREKVTIAAKYNCTELAESMGFKWRDNKNEYVEKIKISQERILDGHTYEVCLTNALVRRGESKRGEELREYFRNLYFALRRRNPAPYGAYFDFSTNEDDVIEERENFSSMYLCCASPERFLRCDQNGNLEAKPIKGTISRVEPLGCAEDIKAATTLQTSVKDNAENLMIVDLLRNDLSLACKVGSVKVPGLLKIESYRTVHQLVSTVVGKLQDAMSPLRAFKFAFPPGSMTGAPKYRTTEIIHELEGEHPREMYSGCAGFWSCRNKAFDANVIIRSVTFKDGVTKIGAGGAITRLSDPNDEWDEVELKARRIVETMAEIEAGERI